MITKIFKQWFEWRKSLYVRRERDHTGYQSEPSFRERKYRFEQYLLQIIQRFQHEVPNFTPRYIGHMNNEISLPGIMGHILSLLHNPNNISGEVSHFGIQIENEAIMDLSEMIGYDGRLH